MHASVALASGFAYSLVLHDCCLHSPKYVSLHPCNATISSYSNWMSLLSRNKELAQESSQLDGLLQSYVYINSLMGTSGSSKPILVLVTGNGGKLEDVECYENVGTQLASLGVKCMVVSLEERNDFRMMQLLSRVNGIYVRFSEMAREVPQQGNLVKYIRDTSNRLHFKMNSDILLEEGAKLSASKKTFTATLAQFLLQPLAFKAFAKRKAGLISMELDAYTLDADVATVKRTRETESFRVKLQHNQLKASIYWKPNIKIVYRGTLTNEQLRVAILLKATPAIFNALLNESTTAFRLLSPQLESFISSIHSTDHTTQRVQKLRRDSSNLEALQEVAAVPLCVCHKWFEVRTVDVVYITKVTAHKLRASYLTDYLMFKMWLDGALGELEVRRVKDSALPTYVLPSDNSFVIVKPVFFTSNAATIFLCFSHNSNIQKTLSYITDHLAKSRKLRLFARPLHLFAFWDPIQDLLAHYKALKDTVVGQSVTDTFLKDIEEENREVFLDEAERELELQEEKSGLGASVHTYVPFEATARSCLESEKWEWSCCYPAVMKSFVSLAVKQRFSEGFLLLSGYKTDVLFVKEETIIDCSLAREGRILLFYVIRHDEQRVQTEFYMERKDAQKPGAENRQPFLEISAEIYRIDLLLSNITWSYHYVKRTCLKKCARRKMNSLKHCGFFLDMAETTASELFILRFFSALMDCYKAYSERKYKEVGVGEKETRAKERFSLDLELVCDNSVELDTQKLVMPELGKVHSKDTQGLKEKERGELLAYIKEKISTLLNEFIDVYLGSVCGGSKKIYGKFVGKRQVMLIVMTRLSDYEILIEYKKLAKNCLSILESKLMNREERRKQMAKKERYKEDFKDELMVLMLEDEELDSETFAEPEIHEVRLELSLLKVARNLQLYLVEEHNTFLLALAHELALRGYFSAEAVEQVLEKSHRFTFAFDLTSVLAFAPFAEAVDVDAKLNELLGTFLKEVMPGCYYYSPKDESEHTQTDRALCNELELLFAELGKASKLPLFVKLKAVYSYEDGTKETRVVGRFSEVLAETSRPTKATLQVVVHFVGKHKEYKGERYYEKRDMDDPIVTEEYYEQFSEGVITLEKSLASIITDDSTDIPQITINTDEYLYQTTNILYPFQARLFAQLIPENYSKGSLVFSLSYNNTRALYTILRPIKAFLSELLLHVASRIPPRRVNEDVVNYVRLKMGELYLGDVESQTYTLPFVDYSQQTLNMLNEEMNSMRYNIRHIDSCYYVVWNSSSNVLQLVNDEYKKNAACDWHTNYKVRYWILLSHSFQQCVAQMQVTTSFGLATRYPEDTPAFIKVHFEDALSKLSNRVNKKVLLSQLNVTKECPDMLFPLSNKPDVPAMEKKEKRSRGKSRHYKMYDSINKEMAPSKANPENPEKSPIEPVKDSPDSQSYTLDLLFAKDIQVNNRVSISNLTDPRYRFYGSSAIRNRQYMYVNETDKAIYVLKLSEQNSELVPKPNDEHTLTLEVYGIEEAEKEFIGELVRNVENQLMTIALTMIAHSISHNIASNSGLLSVCDYRFLAQAEEKVELLFPCEQVNDSYAFMKYVAQNLKRFMITYELGMTGRKFVTVHDEEKREAPTILQTQSHGRVERFTFGKDDPDFNLLYNYMNEVGDIVLGQVFGNGLCLVNMSTLSPPANSFPCEKFVKNFNEYTDQCMNRYVSLLKYNKSSMRTEYVSIFDEELEVVAEKKLDRAFVYPAMVRHKGSEMSVDGEKCGKGNWKKWLRLSLNMKGRINSEELLDSIILYTNQSIVEYSMESSFELIEITILKALRSYELSIEEKGRILLDCLNQFKHVINNVKTFATEIKSSLFYFKEIAMNTQYWNLSWLIAKMINEICSKYFIVQIAQGQFENLCIFLIVSVINNTSKQVQRTYIVKNIHNHNALYSFLKTTFTFQAIQMRNYYLDYQFLVFSKNIPELSPLFAAQIPPSSFEPSVVFVDCLSQEEFSEGGRETFWNGGNAFEFLGAEDLAEENLGSIKARQSIPIRRNGLSMIPRTVFLQIVVNGNNIEVNGYNLNSKVMEGVEEIVCGLETLRAKSYSTLNSMLLKKLGILSAKESEKEVRPAKEHGSTDMATELMRSLVSTALRNRNLNRLNRFSQRERSFVRKLPFCNYVEASEPPKTPAAELGERLTFGNCSSDQVKLVEESSEQCKEVLHSRKGLKYLCVNPFYYHMVGVEAKIELFEEYRGKVMNALQFYVQYGRRNDEALQEQREAEERLFSHLNLAEAAKKEDNELMESLKSISTFSYSYIVPFLFKYDSNRYMNAETGKVLPDTEKAKTTYLNIFIDYFRSLCEMIKAHCNVIELFLASEKTSLRVQDCGGSDAVADCRRRLGKFQTQVDVPRAAEAEAKTHKLTFDSFLLSRKDSDAESEEHWQLPPQPAHKSPARRLVPGQTFCIEECKGYFLNISQGAAYIIELEWMQTFLQVNLWTLPRIMNLDCFPAATRVFMSSLKGLQRSLEFQVDHTINNMISVLRMDAMNYDLHVQFFLHIVNGFRDQRGLLEVVNSFMQYYSETPKKAKNRVSARLITIHMGEFENNAEDFWRYCIANASVYNYKALKHDQLMLYEIPNHEALLDTSLSRKQSKDEEKRDSIYAHAQHKKSQENSTCMQELFERGSQFRRTKRYKKSTNSMYFPQLIHEDSVNERGNIFLCNLAEDSGVFIKSGAESKSSRELPPYQSYVVFGLCSNTTELRPLFRQELTLKFDDFDGDKNSDTEKTQDESVIFTVRG